MGNPLKIPSSTLTKELAKLTSLVEQTNVVSIACYGKKLMDDDNIKQFTNTKFAFLSDDDPTIIGDVTNNSCFLAPLYEQHGMGVMKQLLLSYAANVKQNLHTPDIISQNCEKQEVIDLSKLPHRCQDVLENEFTKILAEEKHFDLKLINDIDNLGDLTLVNIAENHPEVFGAVLGTCIFHYDQI